MFKALSFIVGSLFCTRLSKCCSGEFKIERQNQVIFSENLQYSSPNQPGIDTSSTQTILSGDRVSVTGGDSNYVDYLAIQIPDCEEGETQCTPDGNAILTCVNGEFTDLSVCDTEIGEFCAESSSGAYCKPKFTLEEFSFRNSQNTQDVLAYTSEQAVNVRVLFTSDVVLNSIPATFKILKDDVVINSFSLNLNVNTPNFFSVDSPNPSGTYTTILELTDDGVFKISESSFIISNVPIEGSFKMDTKLIDEDTGELFTSSGNFFTRNEINVEFNVFQLGDPNSLIAFDSFDITATLNNQPVALQSPQIAIGLVRYSIVLENPGLLRFQGIATKLNLQSDLVSKEITVNIPEVRASFLNVGNLVSLIPGTTKTIEFETRSAIGNLIDTNLNSVIVLKSGGTEQPITNIQRDSLGTYSFPYTFGQVGDGPAGYQFFITSQADNHLTSPRTTSPLVNVAPGDEEVLECTSNEQCNSGFECNSNGQCVALTGTSLIFYWIIGIAVLLVVIVIFVVIRKRRQTSFLT